MGFLRKNIPLHHQGHSIYCKFSPMRVLPSLSNTINFLSSSSSKEAVPGKYERDICNRTSNFQRTFSTAFVSLDFMTFMIWCLIQWEDTKDMWRRVINRWPKFCNSRYRPKKVLTVHPDPSIHPSSIETKPWVYFLAVLNWWHYRPYLIPVFPCF